MRIKKKREEKGTRGNKRDREEREKEGNMEREGERLIGGVSYHGNASFSPIQTFR